MTRAPRGAARRTYSVTLIGPDGVGKTTIARRLETSFPVPVKYVYMGSNADASNYLLPTTRWWHARQRRRRIAAGTAESPVRPSAASARTPRAILRFVRKSLGFVNRVLEEAYRELVAAYYQRRGYIVLYDRHFLYDYYHTDVRRVNGHRPWKRRLHGFLISHLLRPPDLVICLDAPGHVAFQRKGEFSVEFLEGRRQEFLSLARVMPNCAVVNADRDLASVLRDVQQVMERFYESGRARA